MCPGRIVPAHTPGMTTSLERPTTGVLALESAASLLGVPADALRTAAEHRLVPATADEAGEYTFTLDQITAISGRRTSSAQPASAGDCCIDTDPDGLRLRCRKCAAAYCALSPKTLANHVHLGTGPKMSGRSGAPRYRKSDLDDWMV